MKTSRFLRTTALVVPFALGAAAVDAADLVGTIEQTGDLETFSKAIESAGMSEQLKGEGPYTIFAPSDEAFEKLPQDARDRLMQDQNQAQLQSLLAQHVVEGKEIAASDVVGQQTKLSTLEGEQLTVDGTSQVVILVPTGLQLTRVGDQIVVEREAAAVAAPSVEVTPTQPTGQSEQSQQQDAQSQQQAGAMSGSEENPEAQASQQMAEDTDRAAQQQDQESARTGTQQQGGTEQQQTSVAEGSDMPVTEHQEEALEADPDTEQQQTAEQESVPSTEHQRQVIRDGEAQGEGQQQAEQLQGAGQQSGESQQQGRTEQQQTPLAEGSDMPVTEHQQEALEADPETEEQQTAEQTSVPSTEHQRQVIRDGEAQGGKGVLREAQVVRPDIEADNGVIHIVDAVLVPQKVLSMLESGSAQGQPSQQEQQQKSTE